MMNRNAALRVMNPIMAALIITQPLSALLLSLTDWEVFEGVHIAGGICLLAGAVVHVFLNWSWVRMNFLKNASRKSSSSAIQ